MSAATAINQERGTFDELVERLGNIPLNRILRYPPPGTATEQDVLDLDDHHDRLCELVDGVLVVKPVGYEESRVSMVLGQELLNYTDRNDVGAVAGADGMLKLSEGLIRIPDVSVILWESIPGGQIPRVPIPRLAPDLAVEVLSESNTPGEMDRKIQEYFDAGARLVWLIDPEKREAIVCRSPEDRSTLKGTDVLSGADILPGFTLALDELFRRASLQRRS